MTTEDFLFELGTEELPPKAITALSATLERELCAQLKSASLAHGNVHTYNTPRRLAVVIEGLQTEQADQSIERKGPQVKGAYDADGSPTQALQGFLRSCGAEAKDLQTLKTDKGEWVVYRGTHTGAKTTDLLPGFLTAAFKKLPIPKLMRWGIGEHSFIRPVKWVVCMLGSTVVNAEFFGHAAGNKTCGHRFLHHDAITISSPTTYVNQLEKPGFVMADSKARLNRIETQVAACAAKLKGSAVMPQSLLEEVAGINEWPTAIACNFDSLFLATPKEALIAAMQEHQKAFAIVDANGTLLPHFVIVSNLQVTDTANIQSGNEKVMNARLADALFFFEQDKKVTLADRVATLDAITYQKDLGSTGNKVRRVENLSAQLAEALGYNKTTTTRTAHLSKADLVSGMVGEFPELQGIMGEYYALHDNEDKAVSQAIRESYLPRFAGDVLPETPEGIAVSLADKIDTLTGIFGINQKPTGSKDPFALRRAAIGVVRLLIEKQLPLGLTELFEKSAALFTGLPNKDVVANVVSFVLERLKVHCQNESISSEMLDAVLSLGCDTPFDISLRLQALGHLKDYTESDAIIAANKRVKNILSKQKNVSSQVNAALFEAPEETALYEMITLVNAAVDVACEKQLYDKTWPELVKLSSPTDAFFEAVMVMCEDGKVRDNRLALLKSLQGCFLQVADISKL
jgi:glycyl-tRNA synthetase beta chain